MAQGKSSAEDNAAEKAEQSSATKVKQSAEPSDKHKGTSGKSGAQSATMRYDIEGLLSLIHI